MRFRTTLTLLLFLTNPFSALAQTSSIHRDHTAKPIQQGASVFLLNDKQQEFKIEEAWKNKSPVQACGINFYRHDPNLNQTIIGRAVTKHIYNPEPPTKIIRQERYESSIEFTFVKLDEKGSILEKVAPLDFALATRSHGFTFKSDQPQLNQHFAEGVIRHGFELLTFENAVATRRLKDTIIYNYNTRNFEAIKAAFYSFGPQPKVQRPFVDCFQKILDPIKARYAETHNSTTCIQNPLLPECLE